MYLSSTLELASPFMLPPVVEEEACEGMWVGSLLHTSSGSHWVRNKAGGGSLCVGAWWLGQVGFQNLSSQCDKAVSQQ